MAPPNGKAFVEGALVDGIPRLAVLLKCRNWGIPTSRAADIAEEASAEAYQRSLDQSFNDANHFRAWVTRTAVNAAIDLLRQQSKAVSFSLIAEFGIAPKRDNEIKDALDDALRSLTRHEQELVALTYEHGLTLDAIAERLMSNEGGSANAKRLRIKRQRDEAIRKLRHRLENALEPSFLPKRAASMAAGDSSSPQL